MIPLQYLTRYAVPLLVAGIYLGDVDIPQQVQIFDKTMRLSDETLAKGRREGEGNEVYDYIVVGGGSAGAILANRLSASGENTVLLLEAGGDPNPLRDIMYANSWGADDSWGYSIVKQNRSCGGSDGFCRWPRGKVLGGCSTVNAAFYNRGKPKDYDSWANFIGDQSWSWENIKDTYNSFEDYHGSYEETADGRHGTSGEMYVGEMDFAPGAEIVEEAAREKGFPVGDLNGGTEQTRGFSRVDRNVKEGIRWGTYNAFIAPILDRTNLVIYRYAYATKVETVSEEEGVVRAVGVTYQRHGSTFTARANKEVVIAGGVVESPKLLMLSGIGPKEHLDEVGIETVLDLPAVGKNLQEHMGFTVKGDNAGFLVNTTFSIPHNTTDSVLQYLHNGTGPMNGFGGGRTQSIHILQGYTHSRQNEDLEWPDIHSYVYSGYDPEADKQEFYFSVIIHRSPTTGNIKLASSDPLEKPVIDPNFFEDPTDIERLVDGVENLNDIFLNSAVFQRYGIQPMTGQACDSHEFGTRDFWRCFAKRNAGPDAHPTSTCRMGPDSTVAVLDSKLKVFGTSNLRVIDASSLPFGPSGNTNLPAMLVGARGAELILSGQ